MKRLLAAAVWSTLTVSALAADVGVSISVGEPGFYGRLDIGNFPPPVLVYPAPVVVRPMPVARAPLYLHVPPGHAKDWRKHCSQYDACGYPVYFVQDGWYNSVYVPQYRQRHHAESKGKGNGKGNGKGRKD